MTAVDQLTALAQETRLEIIKLLANAGSAGLPAGEIGSRLNVLPSTLSFHLAQLTHSGLLRSRRQGRSIIFSADVAVMDDLLGFLTRHFCDSACGCIEPACPSARMACRRTVRGAKSRSKAQAGHALISRPSAAGL